MELAEIRPFEPQMAEIDLFTMPDAVGVGEPSVRKVKPYISGHITDASSTFTFKVNNADVTVPVDANGNWKWVVDRTITSLVEAFKDKSTLDKCYLYKVKTSGSCQNMFQNCTALVELTLDNSLSDTSTLYGFFNGASAQKTVVCKGVTFKNVASCWRALMRCDSIVGLEQATFENSTTCYQMFYNYKGTTLDLRSADFSNSTSMAGMFTIASGSAPLENLNIKKLGLSTTVGAFSNLTEQSVINIFNAVAADGITLTFHPTVYAIIQAQLDIEDSPIYNAYWNSDYDFTIISA